MILLLAFFLGWGSPSFANPIYVQSLEHLDEVLNKGISGSKRQTLVWNRASFLNSEEAEKTLDALLFFRDTGYWILPDGTYLYWKIDREQVFVVNPSTRAPVEVREALANTWWRPRVKALQSYQSVNEVLSKTSQNPEIIYIYSILEAHHKTMGAAWSCTRPLVHSHSQ